MRNFIIYPMQFHLHHSDKRLKKYRANTVRSLQNTSEISYFSNLFKIRAEFEKTYNMKKLRNFIIYSTVYHMHHLDNGLENPSKSSFSVHIKRFRIFKIKFNPSRIREKCEHEKVAVFQHLSNSISCAQFGIIVEKLKVKSLCQNKW